MRARDLLRPRSDRVSRYHYNNAPSYRVCGRRVPRARKLRGPTDALIIFRYFINGPRGKRLRRPRVDWVPPPCARGH